MLLAARDQKVKRFVYAASSSTYGDSTALPKVEENIGKPLSPYAITKYVNELYADIFYKTYGIETIGLRYFNVFGRRQDPNGAYAAVIPKFIAQLLKHKAPGERTTLLELVEILKSNLAQYDPIIADIELVFGPNRNGDIPHSLASIEKAKRDLGYGSIISFAEGIKLTTQAYQNTK